MDLSGHTVRDIGECALHSETSSFSLLFSCSPYCDARESEDPRTLCVISVSISIKVLTMLYPAMPDLYRLPFVAHCHSVCNVATCWVPPLPRNRLTVRLSLNTIRTHNMAAVSDPSSARYPSPFQTASNLLFAIDVLSFDTLYRQCPLPSTITARSGSCLLQCHWLLLLLPRRGAYPVRALASPALSPVQNNIPNLPELVQTPPPRTSGRCSCDPLAAPSPSSAPTTKSSSNSEPQSQQDPDSERNGDGDMTDQK